jgi:hypothetical protein
MKLNLLKLTHEPDRVFLKLDAGDNTLNIDMTPQELLELTNAFVSANEEVQIFHESQPHDKHKTSH